MISPQEKAHFDSIFATVDTAKAGIISGDQAVTFFTNAQLPEDVLAQIWDLADIDADGQLTRDEFAVAMYLVRQQRSRKEPVPAVLPPALIPPSMRRQTAVPRPPAVPPAPAPAPAPAAAALPRSAAEDLFGLDAFNTPAPAASTQFPQSTGGSNPPFQSPGSPSSRTSQQAPSTTFKPFVPSSHFGQSLGPQLTGIGSATRSPPPPSDDLLGDNDPEESKKLTQETSELANLSNQIGSLAKEMQNVQSQRASAEQDLTQTSQQKRDFEARLAQARSMYEKEVKDFKALEERLNASRAETKKFQQEYALLEGTRQDLQSQYEQVSAALASDQNENANLKEKIRQVNVVVSQLKPALEKARSEARQHKGLVAINKKQLATVEGERDKIQGEIETFAKEKENYAEPAQPVTQPADIASPALSTVSQQTNPFFKRQTTGSSERTLPPSPHPQAAFDNLFGPSFTSPTTSTPPPAISFGAGPPSVQHTSDISRSPDTSGIPTPSVSPGPQAVSEPPPPPQSRQITSSSLPLGSEAHAASVTSSTAVSPPVSRFGGGPDASEAGTPLQPASANAVSGSVDNDNDLPSAPATEKSVALSPFDEIPEPSAAPENAENAVSTGEDQAQPFPHMPGSLPVETPPANHEAAATAESANPAKDTSFDELFGNVSRERSQSQKANDFEEAFAGMKPRGMPPANGSNGAGTGEFPPIKELEDDDDDDDSTDDGAPMGFDDNFTPTSPPHKEERSRNESIDATQLHAFPAPGNGATSPQPPPVEAQRSPPSYDDSRATDESGDFPRAFHGLLPSRADPTLAPDAPHAVESSSGAPIVAGEAQEKTTNPDFDAAFAQLDLAPAKEEDDSDDEDIVDPHSDRQGTDFDFSFDSPSQSSKAVTSPSAQHGAPHAAAAEFFNFDHNVPKAATSPSTTQPEASGTATDHDWDAIFAPLKDTQFTVGESNGAAAHSAESKAATSSDSRPPGWALDAGTGEDDLILQRLTGMGYARDESLAALEKFDYNIDKVRSAFDPNSLTIDS
jgi:epidermal growth factor receptor substrate 15